MSGPKDLALYHDGSPGQRAAATRKENARKRAERQDVPAVQTGEVLDGEVVTEGVERQFRRLADLTPDHRNARKHGERNIGMIEKSLEQFGAGRSILVDENGRILAGNGVVEAAANVGIENLKQVEANGNEIVVVVRRGLTEEQKLGIAVADNRAAELAEWDTKMLEDISKDIDLHDFFTEEELGEVLTETERLKETEKELKPKQFVRVLLSIPIEQAGEAKDLIDQLKAVPEIEVDYSAN